MSIPSNEKISVVIPVYKVERFFGECLDSVLCQTYTDIEVILVDDGSPDACPILCDEIAKKDSRVKVIHKQNEGPSVARNIGKACASGGYLFFLDSDDALAPDALSTLYDIIKERDCDVAGCGFTENKEKLTLGKTGEVTVVDNEGAIKLLLQDKKIYAGPWGKLFKAELFDGVDFPKGIIFEDYAVLPKVLYKAKKVGITPSKKYYYRVIETSLMHEKFSERKLQYYEASDMVEAFVEQNLPSLKKLVKIRKIKYTVSFLKQISQSGYSDKAVIKRLTRIVRKSIFPYLFSKGIKAKSKAYALALAVCAPLALRAFRSKKGKGDKK